MGKKGRIRNISVYKETKDNWYPPYITTSGERLVRVSIIRHDKNCTRIVASGNDDFAMEKEFRRYARGLIIFYEIIGSKTVSQSQLSGLGFVQG